MPPIFVPIRREQMEGTEDKTVKEFLLNKDLKEIAPIFHTDIKNLFYQDAICVVCGAPCRVMNGGFKACSKRTCFEVEFNKNSK